MAQENCEGDVSAFSSSQWKLVTDVLNNRGFNDAQVTINAVGEAGDNYVANVKRVIAEKNGETFKMIAKVAPRIEQLRMSMNTRVLFINEHLMYTEVLPKFTELEEAAGIPADERLRYAACYGTSTEELDELILLEDLKESDFTMLDRFKSLTDGDIKLVLKSFAKLHTLSYALKHQEPETYESFENNLIKYSTLFLAAEEQTMKFFELIEADALSLVKDQKHIKSIKGTLSKYLDLLKKNDWDLNSRYSVIQQGDPWTNNIMFKLQEGKSVSCCMIDYQISRINSPVADLLYTILNCTDHETRKQYYNSWIDYYHSELAKSLYEFGLKADYVYPRDQLDADLKRHGKLSVATSILLAFMLCRDITEAEKLKTQMENININMDEIEIGKIAELSEKSQFFFKTRVEDVVDTCLEIGLLY